jgi:ferritin
MGRELAAHLQYLAIGSYFASDGLPELSRFFLGQAAEEHDHAMRFLRYIQDVGAPVSIPGVDAPKSAFEGAEDAVGVALQSELMVTRQINGLVDLAAAANDHATLAFLQWFVSEQVEEVATMEELLQVVRRAGEPNLLLVEAYVTRKRASAPAAPAA